MRKYFCMMSLISAILMIIPFNIAKADTNADVLQVYVSEQTMTAFTNVELNSDALSCAISNQSSEITKSGLVSGEDALIKTTVLIDISTSMPSATRNNVIETLNKLVEIKSASEDMKIVTFGDELNILQDFSVDRYDLSNAIGKIKFDGTQSRIYDAIYNTIPAITPSGNKPTFYRTIVITDGVDDTDSGITKEELFIRLQNEHYLVDVIAVSRSETAENKELSAIVRMSGGRYFTLVPNTDAAELAKTLEVSGYYYFEATVPGALLDGSTRQVDIKDGTHSISLDIKFPVFDVPVVETPIPKEEASVVEVSRVSEVPEVTVLLPIEDETEEQTDDNSMIIYICVAVVLIIIIAVIIVVMYTKKKKEAMRLDTENTAMSLDDDLDEKTDFISSDYQNAQFTIKLSSRNNPSKTWTLPVLGELLIGRSKRCSIQLDDISVSREQCKIEVKGTGLVITNISLTNKTILNNVKIIDSSPLKSGDILKFGREILHVDNIQTSGDLVSKSGKTELLFQECIK